MDQKQLANQLGLLRLGRSARELLDASAMTAFKRQLIATSVGQLVVRPALLPRLRSLGNLNLPVGVVIADDRMTESKLSEVKLCGKFGASIIYLAPNLHAIKIQDRDWDGVTVAHEFKKMREVCHRRRLKLTLIVETKSTIATPAEVIWLIGKAREAGLESFVICDSVDGGVVQTEEVARFRKILDPNATLSVMGNFVTDRQVSDRLDCGANQVLTSYALTVIDSFVEAENRVA